jgi:hypothetical protein
MNNFKLLYVLDLTHKSPNYKNLKMAVIDNISFYLGNSLIIYRAMKLICNRVIHGFESVCLYD